MNAGWFGYAGNPLATCRCGHPADAHDHYRPGTDCSACDCPEFRTAARLRDRFARLFRSPENPHRVSATPPQHDDGLSALLDAVMAEQRRGPCGCLACQMTDGEDDTVQNPQIGPSS